MPIGRFETASRLSPASRLLQGPRKSCRSRLPPGSDTDPLEELNDAEVIPRRFQLFSVSPDVGTEALLANASKDLLSISAIAADLADDVEGSRRSVALAPSRLMTCICWWSGRWIIMRLRPRFSREVFGGLKIAIASKLCS
jgi:hypothetical protein